MGPEQDRGTGFQEHMIVVMPVNYGEKAVAFHLYTLIFKTLL